MTGQRSGTAATPARGGTAARPTQAWRVALTWPRPWAWRPRPDGYLPYLLEDPARAAACLAEDWTVRASINGAGGPLSYDAAHHWWEGYCAAAGVEIDIHQLRHAHATELISSGVSIEAVRRRLGHASTQTTQLYTLLDDKVADDEVRAARRRRDRQR